MNPSFKYTKSNFKFQTHQSQPEIDESYILIIRIGITKFYGTKYEVFFAKATFQEDLLQRTKPLSFKLAVATCLDGVEK